MTANQLIRSGLALCLAALIGLTGCGKIPSLSSLTGGSRAEQPKEPAGMKAVSPTTPEQGLAIAEIRPVPELEMVAGEGDCAPRYANGHMGTCINSKPCRGVGMRGPTGGAECRCWARIGGCAENERCDGVTKACVPESQPDFGRADTD